MAKNRIHSAFERKMPLTNDDDYEYFFQLDNNIDTDIESGNEEEILDELVLSQVKGLESHQNTSEAQEVNENDIVENVLQERRNIMESEPERTWRKTERFTCIPENYNQPQGVNENAFLRSPTAIDIFLELLGPALDDIVLQSNLYAIQKGNTLNLTREELLTLIGIHFVMGYHQVPKIVNYWSSSRDLNVPLISESMPRNRFQKILQFLHVNDNSLLTEDNKDKLYKVRPLLETLNKQFASHYYGSRELSIDESIIKFKGRTFLKQYNSLKPIKRGFKLWCLSDQHGFVKKFDVYQDKNWSIDGKFVGYNLGERVVLFLSEAEWGKNKIIYFDSFFTSVKLLEKLKLENTLACGIIRTNKAGNPKNLKTDIKLKRGEFDWKISNTGIIFFKWKDSKIVNLSSNFHGTEEVTVSRKEKNGNQIQVKAPSIIKDYNAYMGGVDHHDQLRAMYFIDRRSNKWWHRLFFGFIEIAFINSYIIAKYYYELNETKNLLSFRREIALGLISSKSCKRKKVSTATPSPTKRRRYNYSVPNSIRLGNLGNHWVSYKTNRGRCELCSTKGIQSKPHSICSTCGVFLCVNEKKNCFVEYHEIDC